MQAIAAHGQRCGDVLAPKDACLSCKAGYGAFKSCVVLSFEGRTRSYIQGGCCMNCYFTRARSYKCSLCKSVSAQDILHSNKDPGQGVTV